jgi:hypothetical protein
MQKLKGISSGQNNKSCSIIHNRSRKIGFTCFWFFCDFLRNLQESATHFYYWSCAFAVRPLKRTVSSQCGPQAAAADGPAKFRRSRRPRQAGGGRGVAWRGLGSIRGFGWERGAAGEPARRRCNWAATTARCSQRREHGPDNKPHGESQGVLGTGRGWLVVGERPEGAATAMAGTAGMALAPVGDGRALYSRARGFARLHACASKWSQR